jgi:predicted DNA-binding transcriptional regulator AlpA
MAPQLAEDLARNGLYGIESKETAPLIDTFLRLAEVKRVSGLGRSTIYDLMAADPPLFPRPVKIGNGKAVAWSAREIASWQRDRMAARGAPR